MMLKIGGFSFSVRNTKGWFMFDEAKSKNGHCCTEACYSIAHLYLWSNILMVLAKLRFDSLTA